MTTPTNEEIRAAFDMITADGPQAKITEDLGRLALDNPLLMETLWRMARVGVQMRLIAKAEAGDVGLHGSLAGALVYGLHLGLHIGEARARDGK